MSRYKIYFILAAAAASTAMILTLVLPLRYGQHQDNIRCGEGQTHKESYSLFSYYVFANEEGSGERVGTCPYSLYTVKTYAAEVWLMGAVLLLLGSRAKKRATHTMPGSAI